MRVPVGLYIVLRGKSVNNSFGVVRTDRRGNPQLHQGWDIAAFTGSPVYAIADGKVEFVRDHKNNDLGKHICLRFTHQGKTLFALYAHLNTFEVAAGQEVKEGQRLGTVGQTGNARRQHHAEAHLHFEIRTKANAGPGLNDRIDPMFVFGIGPVIDAIFTGLPGFEK